MLSSNSEISISQSIQVKSTFNETKSSFEFISVLSAFISTSYVKTQSVENKSNDNKTIIFFIFSNFRLNI